MICFGLIGVDGAPYRIVGMEAREEYDWELAEPLVAEPDGHQFKILRLPVKYP